MRRSMHLSAPDAPFACSNASPLWVIGNNRWNEGLPKRIRPSVSGRILTLSAGDVSRTADSIPISSVPHQNKNLPFVAHQKVPLSRLQRNKTRRPGQAHCAMVCQLSSSAFAVRQKAYCCCCWWLASFQSDCPSHPESERSRQSRDAPLWGPRLCCFM
jgi:hypothetical protein